MLNFSDQSVTTDYTSRYLINAKVIQEEPVEESLDNSTALSSISSNIRIFDNQSITNGEPYLRADEYGTIRISSTRITLDTVIACYHQGDSPEEIHKGFDVLSLKDIEALILFYLENHAQVDFYLAQREHEAEILRKQIESTYSVEQHERHQRLLQRIKAKRKQSGN